MKCTSSPRTSRGKRVVSIVGLSIFFVLVALTMNLNGAVKSAYAAAFKPMTTPVLPSVFISSPPSQSLYTLPTRIPITAMASDGNPGATITKVEFYSTSLSSTTPMLIGTVLTAPYTITWIPTQASIYMLTARVYDSFGLQYTSGAISVMVEMQSPPPMPVVTITSPANNAAFGQYTSIPIVATLTGASTSSITKVEFYAARNSGTATLIGTATTAPYTITWALQLSGSYSLTAKAYDIYSRVATSAPVLIFVPVRDPLLLNVQLTSPANNSTYTSQTSFPITASVSDPDPTAHITRVDFYRTPAGGTATLIGTATTAPYTIVGIAQQPGTYTLTARAYDNYPGDYGVSPPITIMVIAITPIVTPTPPPSYCKVNYSVSSQWPGGFSVNVTITNTGSAINGWTLGFTFPGDQKITTLWNGVGTQAGEQVTITNASWNGNIAAQGTVSLGFNGSWTSSNASPTVFLLNGHGCS